ncbi:MAG: hypothetical protein U1E66_04145 [Rhodospirillales bacterium]
MRGIFRDRRQRLRASSEAFPPLLANFLETDVSDRPQRCDELLAGLDRARRGETFAANGRVYALFADPCTVEIRNGFDDAIEPLRLSLGDVERALIAWRRAME